MPNIGPMELIVVLVIVLLVFGPKRLPGLGKQLGNGMREFKDSLTSGAKDDDDDAVASRSVLSAAPAAEPVVVKPVVAEPAAPESAAKPASTPRS